MRTTLSHDVPLSVGWKFFSAYLKFEQQPNNYRLENVFWGALAAEGMKVVWKIPDL